MMKIQLLVIIFGIQQTLGLNIWFPKDMQVQKYGSYEDDLVKGLQGSGDNFTAQYDLPWYSGMLSIKQYMPDQADYQLHYYFFPSQHDKYKDPVILWLNGGPGCSSLLGALTEHGPFIFNGDGSDSNHFNDLSWNKKASVIYLESPPGVGFSTGGNGHFNDSYTAQINLAGLLAWFDKFQDFSNQEFYVSGESYGGIYVPTLTYAIHKYNQQATPSTKINLKGMAAGNACTDPIECGMTEDFEPLSYEYFHKQGIINGDLWAQLNLACYPSYKTDECKAILNQCDALIDGINIYNVDGTCYHDPSQTHYSWEAEYLKKKNKRTSEKETPPCVDGKGPVDWLNNEMVKKLTHVGDPSIKFDMCNDTINEQFVREGGSYQYYWPLIENGYRIFVYSGDADGAVPITGTLYWIMKLREEHTLRDIVSWTSFYNGISDGKPQNAGSYWKMDGLTFIRFKGCGHMVPSDDPEGAYNMIEALLSGSTMPIKI